MSSKSEKDRAKQIQDKCQNLLTSMLRDDDNKYCVDCDAKGPRWASWNLGIFLCIRCAGIHRNLGVHISRVKSVNLDAWTPDQVVSLQQMGNSRARAVYEALLPDGFRRPQTDSSLEAFVRAKYEQKKYLAREWVPPPSPKVDWDKEIDEEIERQKKKKKSANATGITNLNTSISNSVIKVSKPETVPQLLPKPNAKTSSSPKTTRSVDRPTVTSNADLLGLDISKTSENQEDMFSGFLSAEPQNFIAQKPEQSEKDILKSEEENFFNQPAPTEKEKTKLTKDSIMALYGSGTATSMQPLPGLAPNCPGYNFPPQNVQFQNPNVPAQFQNQLNNFQVQGFPNTQYQNGIAVSNQFQGQILPQNTYQQFNLQSGMPSQFQVGHPSPNFQQFNVNYSTPPQNQQMNMQFASQQFQQFNMYPQNGGMH